MTFPQLKHLTGMIISPIIIIFSNSQYFNSFYKVQFINNSSLASFIMNPAFLYNFRDTQNQALLDRLESLNRQLFFIFGRERNQERRTLIERELSENTKIIQFVSAYQKYQMLQNEQKKLQICEEQTELLSQELKQQKKQQTEKRDKLKEIKNRQLKLLEAFKKGEQSLQKIHKYDTEIETIEKIEEQIRPKQIAGYLPVLNSIKSQILEQKKQIYSKIKDMKEKTRELKEIKQKEDIKYDGLLKQKFNLAKQFESFKGHEIIKRSKAQRNKIRPKNEQFRVAKRIINHRIISEKVSAPLSYWCWAFILIIWALFLFFLPKMEPSVCY